MTWCDVMWIGHMSNHVNGMMTQTFSWVMQPWQIAQASQARAELRARQMHRRHLSALCGAPGPNVRRQGNLLIENKKRKKREERREKEKEKGHNKWQCSSISQHTHTLRYTIYDIYIHSQYTTWPYNYTLIRATRIHNLHNTTHVHITHTRTHTTHYTTARTTHLHSRRVYPLLPTLHVTHYTLHTQYTADTCTHYSPHYFTPYIHFTTPTNQKPTLAFPFF